MKLIILLVLITFSENIIKVTLLDLNIKNTKSEYVNLGNLSKDKDEIHSIRDDNILQYYNIPFARSRLFSRFKQIDSYVQQNTPSWKSDKVIQRSNNNDLIRIIENELKAPLPTSYNNLNGSEVKSFNVPIGEPLSTDQQHISFLNNENKNNTADKTHSSFANSNFYLQNDKTHSIKQEGSQYEALNLGLANHTISNTIFPHQTENRTPNKNETHHGNIGESSINSYNSNQNDGNNSYIDSLTNFLNQHHHNKSKHDFNITNSSFNNTDELYNFFHNKNFSDSGSPVMINNHFQVHNISSSTFLHKDTQNKSHELIPQVNASVTGIIQENKLLKSNHTLSDNEKLNKTKKNYIYLVEKYNSSGHHHNHNHTKYQHNYINNKTIIITPDLHNHNFINTSKQYSKDSNIISNNNTSSNLSQESYIKPINSNAYEIDKNHQNKTIKILPSSINITKEGINTNTAFPIDKHTNHSLSSNDSIHSQPFPSNNFNIEKEEKILKNLQLNITYSEHKDANQLKKIIIKESLSTKKLFDHKIKELENSIKNSFNQLLGQNKQNAENSKQQNFDMVNNLDSIIKKLFKNFTEIYSKNIDKATQNVHTHYNKNNEQKGNNSNILNANVEHNQANNSSQMLNLDTKKENILKQKFSNKANKQNKNQTLHSINNSLHKMNSQAQPADKLPKVNSSNNSESYNIHYNMNIHLPNQMINSTHTSANSNDDTNKDSKNNNFININHLKDEHLIKENKLNNIIKPSKEASNENIKQSGNSDTDNNIYSPEDTNQQLEEKIPQSNLVLKALIQKMLNENNKPKIYKQNKKFNLKKPKSHKMKKHKVSEDGGLMGIISKIISHPLHLATDDSLEISKSKEETDSKNSVGNKNDNRPNVMIITNSSGTKVNNNNINNNNSHNIINEDPSKFLKRRIEKQL